MKHNEVANKEARLRRAARKKGLSLQKGSYWELGERYTGYRVAVGPNMNSDIFSGNDPLCPYNFSIEDAERFIEEYEVI